jgi:hypothetical protein
VSEESLRRVLTENANKITKFVQEYQSNENEVRRTLVEPVLEALGWNIRSLEDVRSEFKTEDRQILDYMLRKRGTDILVVEVKAQREKLENHLNQLAVYCSNLGVSFGVITDGAIWILFKTFEEGVKGRDRIVFSVDTRTDPTSVGKLLRISKERIDELGLLKEQMLTFQEVWDQVVESPDFLVRALQPRISEMLKEKKDALDFKDEDLRMFLQEQVSEMIGTTGASLPSHPQMQPAGHAGRKGTMWIDDESYPIKTFKDIIVNTAEWLIRTGRLSQSVVPIQIGPKTYLVNTTRNNPEGKSMFSPKKLSNGMYVETNASSYDAERWARKMLSVFGLKEELLRVERNE